MSEPSEFEELTTARARFRAIVEAAWIDYLKDVAIAQRFLDFDQAMADDPIGTVAAVLGFDKED